MSTQAVVLIVVHLPLLYWLVWVDRFYTWNRWADELEAHVFPPWFRWEKQGDPVSWVQHGLTAFAVSLYGGILSLLAPESFALGALIGAWVAWAAYVVREGLTIRERWGRPLKWSHPSPHRVGWMVDGILDTVGPLIVALAWTVFA